MAVGASDCRWPDRRSRRRRVLPFPAASAEAETARRDEDVTHAVARRTTKPAAEGLYRQSRLVGRVPPSATRGAPRLPPGHAHPHERIAVTAAGALARRLQPL